MSVRGLWGGEKHAKCEKLSFEIIGEFGEHKIEHAIAVSRLDLPCQSLSRDITDQINSQHRMNVEPYKNAKPLLLIGQDNWRLIGSFESRPIRDTGLVISRSPLGWALHGYCENGQDEMRTLNVHATCCVNDCAESEEARKLAEFDELIRQFFIIDNLGISAPDEKKKQSDRASKILRETTRKVGNAWETGLLWKSDTLPNLNTRATALKRLRGVEKRQDRDPEFAAMYHREMNRLIENGYAVKIDKNRGKDNNSSRIRYISHFGVTNPNKPGKLRLVFDAAESTALEEGDESRSPPLSMNDLLETGPDLLESLIGVLIRFRQYPYAVTADIKDMFLRVKIIKRDRDSQRFLYRGSDRNREPDEYVMTSLIFGSKSSPCSALYVKNTNAKQFEREKPEAANSIIRNSYMDDYLASGPDIEKMRQLVNDVSMINRAANFEMHDWASNHPDIVSQVHEADKLGVGERASLCNKEKRVLGLYWDPITDSLRFNVGLGKIKISIVTGTEIPTKREVLSIVMSVYDPLGILAPFTLNAKLIIQDIWVSGVSWDMQIRDKEFGKWLSWLKALQQMSNCTIPRSFIPAGAEYKSTQLHVFCDASKVAFAAAAYLRITARDDSTHVTLVMGKTRNAPVKPTTIPRLELQAALLGTELAATIIGELEIKINERIFWSDSTTVLHWIKTGPRSKQIFVANRLGKINAATHTNEWRWVPTELNPADDGTRPSSKPMQSGDRWLVGPEFLRGGAHAWPRSRELNKIEREEAENLETRKEFVGALFANRPRPWESSARTADSGWYRIVRKAMSLKNFLQILCREKRDQSSGSAIATTAEKKETPLEKIIAAEKFWYRLVQRAYFPNELDALKKGEELPRGSKLISLQPYIDEEGLLRAKGRVTKLFNSGSGKREEETTLFENRPIILNARHYATKLLIESYHELFAHGNNETIVNELRQQFYIIGLRTTLRWLAKKCTTCRVKRAKPENPPMADLPKCRLDYQQPAFSQCGIDYFGPMYAKVGRKREKRWGVLFTCMTTRAIHLEVAHSLTASSTIMAIERLAGRRGWPRKIYSDNGTNFIKASKDLNEAINKIDNAKIEKYAIQSRKFDWVFNIADAPHMGGAWERLIRSVKIALNHALNDESYTDEALLTILIEIEHMVNSRPITHVSIDPNDNEALTPNHILLGRSSGYPRMRCYEAEILSPRRTFEIVQNLARSFWTRWLREYLPTLLPRKKWHKPTNPIQVGDIVLIVDYQTPRNTWRKGRVIEVYKNKSDGVVRSAKIRAGKSFLERPAHKLIKILETEK